MSPCVSLLHRSTHTGSTKPKTLSSCLRRNDEGDVSKGRLLPPVPFDTVASLPTQGHGRKYTFSLPGIRRRSFFLGDDKGGISENDKRIGGAISP
jgi:hypothetical protein